MALAEDEALRASCAQRAPVARRPAAAVVSVAGVAAYALAIHWLFRAGWLDELNVMSLGFLLVTPVTMGVLVALLARRQGRSGWRHHLATAWLACALWAGINAVLSFEPALCMVMAAPALLVTSGISGLGAMWLLRSGYLRRPAVIRGLGVALLVAPLLVGWLEGRWPPESALRQVHTEIIIAADREVIWDNITRVREIQPNEQQFSVLHTLGLPKPREAVLTYDGVGGIRDAMFEGGLTFVETVYEWEYQRMMSFTIEIDHSHAVPGLIQAIDSRYFEVLTGTYRIEPLGDGSSRLHLDSVERLGTRFNWYAGVWTDAIMYHLQTYILRIIRQRCEAQAAPVREPRVTRESAYRNEL